MGLDLQDYEVVRTQVKNKLRRELYVLGVDLSLTGTGVVGGSFSQINDDFPSCTNFLLETKAGDGDHELELLRRALFVRDSILEATVQGQKQAVVFLEGYAMGFGKKGRLFDLAELGSLVKLGLVKKRIPFFVVPPTSLKKFITGKGNAQKADVRMGVYKRYGQDIANDNLCDAYGLCRMGFSFLQFDDNLTKVQQESLKPLWEKYHWEK